MSNYRKKGIVSDATENGFYSLTEFGKGEFNDTWLPETEGFAADRPELQSKPRIVPVSNEFILGVEAQKIS